MRRAIDLIRLRQLIETANLPDRAIAEKLGVSFSTVHNYRQRWGFILPGGSKYEKDERIMAIIRNPNLSIAQASEQAGVSDTTVERIRRKYGVVSVFAQAFQTAKATLLANTEAERQQTEQRQQAAERIRKAASKPRKPLVFATTTDELNHLYKERNSVEDLMNVAAMEGNSADYQLYAKQYSALTYKIEFCESRLHYGQAQDTDREGGRNAFWNGHAHTQPEPIIQ